MKTTTVINDARFLNDIADELQRARNKFPSSDLSLAALHEESGEVAKALLELKYGNGPKQDVWKEAVQVAVMALRIAVEGDETLCYHGRDW